MSMAVSSSIKGQSRFVQSLGVVTGIDVRAGSSLVSSISLVPALDK